MRLVHCLIGFLILFLVAGGMFVLYGAVGHDLSWEQLFMFLYEDHMVAIGGLVAAMLILLLFALTAPSKREPAEFISYQANGAVVSISLKAVKDFVQKIAGEFAAVVSMYPTLKVRGGGIEVDLDVRVSAGTHIPELCNLLQERVRESMSDTLGLSDVRTVKVNVREIVSVPNEVAEMDTEGIIGG